MMLARQHPMAPQPSPCKIIKVSPETVTIDLTLGSLAFNTILKSDHINDVEVWRGVWPRAACLRGGGAQVRGTDDDGVARPV